MTQFTKLRLDQLEAHDIDGKKRIRDRNTGALLLGRRDVLHAVEHARKNDRKILYVFPDNIPFFKLPLHQLEKSNR